MTDRPILFSAPMVRAIVEGRKMQTRRILKPQPIWEPEMIDGCTFGAGWSWGDVQRWSDKAVFGEMVAPYVPFSTGDRLWVKETWKTVSGTYNDLKPSDLSGEESLQYLADGQRGPNWIGGKTRVSIFMPRWASRITLDVTDVRVEKLQEISEADAKSEGITTHQFYPDDGHPLCDGYSHKTDDDCILHVTAKEAFEALWDNINGKREGCTWTDNPWVVAISFDVSKGNIDD